MYNEKERRERERHEKENPRTACVAGVAISERKELDSVEEQMRLLHKKHHHFFV